MLHVPYTDEEHATERSNLLSAHANGRRVSQVRHVGDVTSIISSHLSKQERALADTPIGERLPYNDYTTIDWLHDLVRLQLSRRSRIAQLTWLKGERLLPLSFCSFATISERTDSISVRLLPRMASSCTHWPAYRLRCFPRRYSCSHGE